MLVFIKLKHFHFLQYYSNYKILPYMSVSTCATPACEQDRDINKYRQKASLLFEKLQNLQQSAEINRSKDQHQQLQVFEKTEKKVVESSKLKEGWYADILAMVKDIEKQIFDQKTQAEKCRKSMNVCIQSTERQLNQNFQRLSNEAVKSQAALEKFIEGKIQSFILKNKSAWNQGTLIDGEPVKDEVQHLRAQYKKFISEFQKECERVKKETMSSIKQYVHLVNEEINSQQEDQIISLLKHTHQDVSSKLHALKDQRERTEERVLDILEKVVKSCIVPSYVK